MRILYVIGGYGHEHLGGGIHHELAHQILAAGHDYEVFAPTHARHMEGRSAEAVEGGVRVHRVVCAGRTSLDLVNGLSRHLFRAPWFATSLVGLLRVLRTKAPFDVIFTESAYPLGAEVALATRLSPCAIIVSVIGGDFIASRTANYGYGRYRVSRSLMRYAFRRAALVRAVSPHAARSAIGLGCRPDRLAVVQRNIANDCFIPGGVEPARFRSEARARVTSRIGLGAGRLIVAVGRLIPIKGFDHLIRALPTVLAGAGETHLAIVGPNRIDSRLGSYRDHLASLALDLGVSPRVTFTDALPHAEVRDFLAAADVVAVPSIEEGGNKIVMEAAAVGTPLVATRTAGTGEWAGAWNCGIVVEPSDPLALAESLVAVLTDPTRAATMGAQGRLFADSFRPEVVSKLVLDLCRCAIARTPIPASLRAAEQLDYPRPGLSPFQ